MEKKKKSNWSILNLTTFVDRTWMQATSVCGDSWWGRELRSGVGNGACHYGDGALSTNYCAMPAKMAEKNIHFSTQLRRCSRIRLPFAGTTRTTWHATLYCINLPHLRHWLRAALLGRYCGLDNGMLLELFYMLEVCCGSGASSGAMITHMRRMGRGVCSLLVDYMTLEQLLAMYPELAPYIEDGSITYFEACLTQMRQGDLQLHAD